MSSPSFAHYFSQLLSLSWIPWAPCVPKGTVVGHPQPAVKYPPCRSHIPLSLRCGGKKNEGEKSHGSRWRQFNKKSENSTRKQNKKQN